MKFRGLLLLPFALALSCTDYWDEYQENVSVQITRYEFLDASEDEWPFVISDTGEYLEFLRRVPVIYSDDLKAETLLSCTGYYATRQEGSETWHYLSCDPEIEESYRITTEEEGGLAFTGGATSTIVRVDHVRPGPDEVIVGTDWAFHGNGCPFADALNQTYGAGMVIYHSETRAGMLRPRQPHLTGQGFLFFSVDPCALYVVRRGVEPILNEDLDERMQIQEI